MTSFSILSKITAERFCENNVGTLLFSFRRGKKLSILMIFFEFIVVLMITLDSSLLNELEKNERVFSSLKSLSILSQRTKNESSTPYLILSSAILVINSLMIAYFLCLYLIFCHKFYVNRKSLLLCYYHQVFIPLGMILSIHLSL